MATSSCGLLLQLHLAFLMLLWSTGYAQNFGQVGGSCVNPNRQAGQCISIDSCQPYLALLNQRPPPPNTVNFLRRAQCGFRGNRPYVCCPNSGSIEPQSGGGGGRPTTQQGGGRPTTQQGGGGGRPTSQQGGGGGRPTSQQGGGTRPNANELFGTGGGGSTPTTTGGGGTVTNSANVANHANWRLLRTDTCGADVNDRIFGGEEANLKEYPWLALLGYQTRTGRQFLCGGSLISTRYVLTAAHCVRGIGNTRLVSVRLGEHNTDTDPDCMDYQDGRVCGDPVQDFNIAEVIAHPQYRSESRDKHHDIALIRLDREAPITDYIVPICIPNGVALSKRYESDSMIVAGWGRTENKTASNVKLWVRVPVMTNAQCAPVYQRQITLNTNQMCAGGQQGKDSCRGDSGGPLMAVDSVVPQRRGGQWVVAGVVSIGPNICATEGRPGIYTRVGPYVSWILDSLKP